MPASRSFLRFARLFHLYSGVFFTPALLFFAFTGAAQSLNFHESARGPGYMPPAILVTCGFDMLRDVGHAYAQQLAAAGNDISYLHYPDLPHGIIQMTAHSKACLDATNEIAALLGRRLAA